MDRLVPMKKKGNGVTEEQLRRAGAELFHILNRDGSFSPAYLESAIDRAKRITVRDHAPAVKLPTVGVRKQGTRYTGKGCHVPSAFSKSEVGELITVPKMAKLLNVPPWFLRKKMKLVEGRILSWGVDAHGVKLFKYHELLKVFDNAKKTRK